MTVFRRTAWASYNTDRWLPLPTDKLQGVNGALCGKSAFGSGNDLRNKGYEDKERISEYPSVSHGYLYITIWRNRGGIEGPNLLVVTISGGDATLVGLMVTALNT